MAKQGKCIICKRRYTWKREYSLKLAHCPKCGAPLKQTSHLSNFVHERLTFTPAKVERSGW